MFQYGTVVGGIQIEHQHDDGSWAPMEPRDPHDAADYDPERDWERGRVYVCTTCQETIRILGPDDRAAEAPTSAA